MTLEPSQKILVVLGPTASGKTRLAVTIARAVSGEIISADSRQVYRGLNIGAGKDLEEYGSGPGAVPCHGVDIASLENVYSVYHFQAAFLRAVETIGRQGHLPILTGGTGLYLDAALGPHKLSAVPEDAAQRRVWETVSDQVLAQRLAALKPLHNTTDLDSRARLVRALEIAEYNRRHPPVPMPPFAFLVLGVRWPRHELRERIAQRLDHRLEHGLIEEVQGLLAQGIDPDRLRGLGLEYRFVTDYVEGRLSGYAILRERLFLAIADFAKRQETWFRRMQRRGIPIAWIDRGDPQAALEDVNAWLDRVQER